MKRIGYLHDKVYNIENKQEENEKLSEQLKDLVYETSEYSTFKIYEPNETLYCLKMDVRKFYPSINHDILCEIIYSADGVPIGNYLSQFFANLYLAYFDHWVKEELKCKFYFRYADDIVILSSDKNFLRTVLIAIKMYLKEVLDLRLKPNYQIFPVDDRGIDFVGYRFYHTHVLLRKSIKIDRQELRRRMQSYFGWLKFCNSKNLLRKIQRETGLRFSNWDGKKSNISRFYNKYIHVVDMVSYSKCFRVNFVYNNKSYYFESYSTL